MYVNVKLLSKYKIDWQKKLVLFRTAIEQELFPRIAYEWE